MVRWFVQLSPIDNNENLPNSGKYCPNRFRNLPGTQYTFMNVLGLLNIAQVAKFRQTWPY